MSTFTVFTTIKGLKQECICLEQKLSEQRKRENVERTLDAMKTKNGQVRSVGGPVRLIGVKRTFLLQTNNSHRYPR